jgi:type IV secretory pathway TraG/TraD family ATPase VirD4
MRLFASRENLLNLLSKTDFDYQNINKEKTAIFIISNNKPVSKILIPLIIEEIYYSATLNENGKRLNIVIDDFENLIPIKNFSNILTLSRSYNIKFTIYIRSILELRNAYGKEGTEVLKIVFGNIIYLLSYDIETLEDISKLCGNTLTEKGLVPLITEDELKLLDNFEAIILIPRINPIKTKLIPDFEIKWDFDKEVVPLIKNDNKDIKIFKL